MFVGVYYEKISPHLVQNNENTESVEAPGEGEENLEATEDDGEFNEELHGGEEELIDEPVRNFHCFFMCYVYFSYVMIFL